MLQQSKDPLLLRKLFRNDGYTRRRINYTVNVPCESVPSHLAANGPARRCSEWNFNRAVVRRNRGQRLTTVRQTHGGPCVQFPDLVLAQARHASCSVVDRSRKLS